MILFGASRYDETMPDDDAEHPGNAQDQSEEAEFYTVPQVAALLTVSPPTVYIALREGRLPFVTKYGKRLISRTALAEYRARTRPTGEKPRGRPKTPPSA